MSAPEIPITITRGKTFAFGFLYADEAKTYKTITAMPQLSPVRLTVTAHDIPDGWPVQISCVKAPTELNTATDSYVAVKVIDADTIELPNVNAYCWKAYSPGGLVVFNTPVDLTGWACRAQVRTKVGGELLFSWHSDPAENPDGLIEIDGAGLTFNIDAVTTAALTWSKGTYDAELIDPSGNVYAMVAPSNVTVVSEVTI
jgi:hypothetical protein